MKEGVVVKRYAFLRNYYCSPDKPDLFGIDISDNRFVTASYMISDWYKIQELLNDPNYVKNYSFTKEGYLQCEDLIRLDLDLDTYCNYEPMINQEFALSESLTLLRLLKVLLNIDAKFILHRNKQKEEATIVNVDVWGSTGNNDVAPSEPKDAQMFDETDIIVPCSKVKFSRSTMSVYFNYFDSDGIHNRNIIRYDDTEYIFTPFSFLIPTGKKEEFVINNAEFVGYLKEEGMLEYNKEDFIIYTVLDSIPLVATDENLSPGLLHKSIICSERYNNVIKILKDLMTALCNNNDDDNSTKWAGKNRSYATNYGIYFRTEYVAVPEARRIEILNFIIRGKRSIKKCASEEQVCALMAKVDNFKDFEEKLLAQILGVIVYSAEDRCEMISLTQHHIAVYELRQAFADLYNYRMRSCFLLNNESIGTYNISGSDEIGRVIVKESLR